MHDSPIPRPLSGALLLGLVACAPAVPLAPAPSAPSSAVSPATAPPSATNAPAKPVSSAADPAFVDAFGKPVHRRPEDAKCAEDELWDPAASACRWYPGGGYGAAGCSMGGGGIVPKACVTGATFTGCDCTCKEGTAFDGGLRRCR